MEREEEEARSRDVEGVWEWAREPVRPRVEKYYARARQRQTRRRDCVGIWDSGEVG